MSAPGIASNPVVAELFSQLTRYRGARDSLRGGRFGRPETNAEVQKLDGLIAATNSRLTGAVASYLNALDARIGAVDRLRAQSSSAFPELSASEEEEAGLEEEVEAARVTVVQLRAEYEKARLAEAVEVGQVEIVSLAALPRGPVGVSKARKGVFVILLGLVLGLAAALVAERFSTSVRRRGQVERALHVSELAVIPAIAPARRRTLSRRDDRGRPLALRPGQKARSEVPERLGEGLVVASDVHSIAAEAYRLLRTNLIFSLSTGAPRTVLITSAAPGEGKTTVAANLAIAFAQQGMRVLLVDADMRRGRVHDLFRMTREPGLSQVLADEIALKTAVRPTPVTGLFALTTGKLPDAPSELVGATSMRRLLDDATQEYGVVVMDSPPVLAAADASVITSIVDATIIVVRAGQTDQDEAEATIDQLTAVGGRVVGAVLNDPNAKLRASAGYYKYYGPAR
jgi:tyrosine-protein kinase Etk/Wzc